MPCTLLTAASDVLVLAGAAAVATAVLNSKNAPFRTSLGTEFEDDSLVPADIDDAIGTHEQQPSTLQEHARRDKKAPTVTVTEIAVTPSTAEMRKDDFFAGANIAKAP